MEGILVGLLLFGVAITIGGGIIGAIYGWLTK